MLSQNAYLARQPILDREGELYGFELLFRRGDTGVSNVTNGMEATSTVVANMIVEMGVAQVLGQFRGFLNTDAEFIASDLIELLPPEKVVLEVLEHTQVDREFVQRCIELAKRGFDLAIDDYSGDFERIEPLLPLAKMVKIDLGLVPFEHLDEVCIPLRRYPVQLVAEKVETHEQFARCKEAGFHLFQGYHFARPELLTAKRSSLAKRGTLRLMALAYGDAEVREIEEEFKRHPQLGYNLLKMVNSAAAGLSTKIGSIKHALVMLGRRQLQVWLQLLLYTGESSDRQLLSPLLQTAAMRGRIMEAIAQRERPDEHSYHDQAFMTGILSLIDVLLDTTRAEVLDQLNLADEVKDALLEGKGPIGRLLTLVEGLEGDDRATVHQALARSTGVAPAALLRLELSAFRWANNLLDVRV